MNQNRIYYSGDILVVHRKGIDNWVASEYEINTIMLSREQMLLGEHVPRGESKPTNQLTGSYQVMKHLKNV